MDIVVVLALIVLVAVFLFSLFMIVVTCHRKRQYKRLVESQQHQHSLRFSKLQQENLEDIGQLGPHISQALDRNQWVEQLATGLLQHCVACLKLCHQLTERMAQHPQLLNGSCQPELNELICRATRRIFPRFDALLRSMAAPDVDVRVIEARLEALVSACWALAAPFAVASPEHKSGLEELILQMDKHMAEMQLALERFEEEEERKMPAISAAATAEEAADDDDINNGASTSTAAQKEQKETQQNHLPTATTMMTTSIANSNTTQMNRNSRRNGPVRLALPEEEEEDGDMKKKPAGRTGGAGAVSLRIEADIEASSSLLTDEKAPADPAIT